MCHKMAEDITWEGEMEGGNVQICFDKKATRARKVAVCVRALAARTPQPELQPPEPMYRLG